MALNLKGKSVAAAAPAAAGVNFGDLGFYVAGGGIPEGDYVWTKLEVKMHQAVNAQGQNRGAARLGVLITMQDRNDLTESGKHEGFYSMGRKAHLSFMPNNDGSGLMPVPNAPAQTLPDSTNWAVLVKSLYDSALPVGVFTNSTKVFEGMWCHISRVPEPESRKGFAASSTGDAADEEFTGSKGDGKIAVVTDIPEEGQPWNGTGGLPAAAQGKAAAPAKPQPRVNGKAVPVAVAPTPAPTAAAEGDDEEIIQDVLSRVLMTKPEGLGRLVLRNESFKILKAERGDEYAGQLVDAVFNDASQLAASLNTLGYQVSGAAIKPLA